MPSANRVMIYSYRLAEGVNPVFLSFPLLCLFMAKALFSPRFDARQRRL